MEKEPGKRTGTLNMGDLGGCQPSEGKTVLITNESLYKNGSVPFNTKEEEEALKETTFPNEAVQVQDRL